ncbi:MAG: hypothetical protein WBC68_16680, partial [Albidovulum sp.]
MNTEDFAQFVVEPNLEYLKSHPGSYQHAINTIFSIDAIAGFIAYDENSGGINRDQDKVVRDEISNFSPAFELIRDASFTIKHGFLKGTNR